MQHIFNYKITKNIKSPHFLSKKCTKNSCKRFTNSKNGHVLSVGVRVQRSVQGMHTERVGTSQPPLPFYKKYQAILDELIRSYFFFDSRSPSFPIKNQASGNATIIFYRHRQTLWSLIFAASPALCHPFWGWYRAHGSVSVLLFVLRAWKFGDFL